MFLLKYGDISDAPRFWRAKRANFDTWAGGYDIEFVFAAGPRAKVLAILRASNDPESLDEALGHYDLDTIAGDLAQWRAELYEQFPQAVSELDGYTLEHLADLFDDREAIEELGLAHADGPSQRARVYRRLEKYEQAMTARLEAAAQASGAWDEVSELRDAFEDAAKAKIALVAEAQRVDRLRSEIDSWRVVGLGRMTTQSCYEMAAAVDDRAAAVRLLELAQSWRRELRDFPLAGLRAALRAARRWGEATEIAELEHARAEEAARIGVELSDA